MASKTTFRLAAVKVNASASTNRSTATITTNRCGAGDEEL